jgi:F-box and WD-40 domain protein CDC4
MLSCGNDGKTRLWDLKSGRLIRNFSAPGKTVWKLQFSDTKAVVLKQLERPVRHTVMEVHDFDAVDDDDDDDDVDSSNGDTDLYSSRSTTSPLPSVASSSSNTMMMDTD